jgi:hypothetical protein
MGLEGIPERVKIVISCFPERIGAWRRFVATSVKG